MQPADQPDLCLDFFFHFLVCPVYCLQTDKLKSRVASYATSVLRSSKMC